MSRFWSPVIRSLSPYMPGEQPKLDGILKLNVNEIAASRRRGEMDLVRRCAVYDRKTNFTSWRYW